MTKAIKWLALSILALAFPVVNTHASIPAADGTYTGCLFKSLGTVRLIDPAVPKQKCLAGVEVLITWNQKAPPDPTMRQQIDALTARVAVDEQTIAQLRAAIATSQSCDLELRIIDAVPQFAVSDACKGPPPDAPILVAITFNQVTGALVITGTGTPMTMVRAFGSAICTVPMSLMGIPDVQADGSGNFTIGVTIQGSSIPFFLTQYVGRQVTADATDRFGRVSPCSAPVVGTLN
jgi:hypothetical protein